MKKPTYGANEKGLRGQSSFNAPKSQKRSSTVSNVPLIDTRVNYQQYILCVSDHSMQIRAWINHAKTSRESLTPFLSNYELRCGVGEWFDSFSIYDGEVCGWCDTTVSKQVPRVDLARVARGLVAVAQWRERL